MIDTTFRAPCTFRKKLIGLRSYAKFHSQLALMVNWKSEYSNILGSYRPNRAVILAKFASLSTFVRTRALARAVLFLLRFVAIGLNSIMKRKQLII